MKKALLLTMLILVGCSTKSISQFTGKVIPDEHILCENKPYSDEDLRSAALNVLYPKLRHFYMGIPDNTLTKESLADAKGRIPPLVAWVNTIENAKIKNAYLFWLNFYRDQYDELQSRIDRPTPTQPSVAEVGQRERQEKEARAEALEKCLPKPN